MRKSLEQVSANWERLRVIITQVDKAVAEQQLKLALEECIKAGQEILGAMDRERLQKIAKDIAQKYFEITGIYPNAVIDPPDRKFLSAVPKKSAFARSLNLRVISISLLMGIVIVLVAFIFYSLSERLERAEAVTKALLHNPVNSQKSGSSDTPMAIIGTTGDVDKLKTDYEESVTVNRGLRAVLDESFFALDSDRRSEIARERCLEVIRACYIESGKLEGYFRLFRGRDDLEKSATVIPSFANLAALALITVNDKKQSAETKAKDRDRVFHWLLRYAELQGSEIGEVFQHKIAIKEGTATKLDKIIDDQAAGTYLELVGKYYTGDLGKTNDDQKILAATKLALQIILARPIPGEKVENKESIYYLMTGVVDYSGLISASKLFKRSGEQDLSTKALQRAGEVGKQLRSFLQPSESATIFPPAYSFKTQRHDWNTTFNDKNLAPNLFGLTWINKEDIRPWNLLVKESKPGDDNEPNRLTVAGPVELWLAAAQRLNQPIDGLKRSDLLYRTQLAAYGFHPSATYLDRAAITLLVLEAKYTWRNGVAE